MKETLKILNTFEKQGLYTAALAREGADYSKTAANELSCCPWQIVTCVCVEN